MNTLATATRIAVSRALCEQALQHMRSAGRQGLEGVALWAGRLEGHTVRVSKTMIPKQTALGSSSGLLYLVEGDELHRLTVELYRNRLTLIAQLHSHPGEAYQSDTDDEFPIATTEGSLSIVVPNFARGPLDPSSWAVYRLQPGGWIRLHERNASDLICIEEP